MRNDYLENLENIDCSGIYMFKNKVNGKCYVGQSVNLRKRLHDHIRCYNSNITDTVIHRAFNKYGLFNFEIIILERLEYYEGIKERLDLLEKEYITKYNSYLDGYNSTLGGDAGVLGLKMTEEQKAKIRRGSILTQRKKEKQVYIEDISTNTIYRFISLSRASKALKIERSNVTRNIKGEYTIIKQKFMCAFSVKELQEKVNYYKSHPKLHTVNSGKFVKGDPRLVGKHSCVKKPRKPHKMPEHQKEFIRNFMSKYNFELYLKTGEFVGLYIRRDLLLEAHPDITRSIFKCCDRVPIGEFANYKQYKIRRFPKNCINQ